MTAQPGFVSLQMHKGTAGSRLLMNVAVREPIEALATTFISPELQRMAATFPDDVVSYPHIFERVDVWHRNCRSVTVLVSDPALHGTLATRSASDTPDERSTPIPSSNRGQALPGHGPAFHPGSDARRTGLQDADPAAPSAPSAAERAVSASGTVRGPGTAAVAAARSRWDFVSSSNRP